VNDDYILPGELAVLVVFLFVPPLLLVLAGQAWFLWRRRVRAGQVVRLLCATAAASVLLGVPLFLFGSAFLPYWLRMQDLRLGHGSIPVLPLALLVASLAASAITWPSVRRRI
jgi:hypothetical protein